MKVEEGEGAGGGLKLSVNDHLKDFSVFVSNLLC